MRDLFDRQMEITDELIDRKLPTHIDKTSSTMEKNKHQTAVVFRRFKDGDIIALFPGLKERSYSCLSYMHVGQHGPAEYQHVIASTKPAKPKEYEDLKRELEGLGYNLRVIQRRPTTIPA